MPNAPGFLFPFVDELAKPDDEGLIPLIFKDHFYNTLGNDANTCAIVFENLKSGWGILKETDIGHRLAHLYTGIDLALRTGAGIKMLWNGFDYAGYHLYGTHFNIVHQGALLDPAPYVDLQASYDDTLPHANSLTAILDLVNYATPADRTAQPVITSVQMLRGVIQRWGYNINNEQAIRSHALQLKFQQPFLPINASNIANVLRAFTQPEAVDGGFPLHPLYLLSANRHHRLWSSFGAHGPTFLIPGGRIIPLTGNFSWTEKARVGKSKIEHQVTRMHCQVVPIEKAVADLDLVLSKKDIHSPIGTPLARKASSLSLFREFKDASATDVLAALRLAAGVVLTGSGNPRKRQASPIGVAGSSKKQKIESSMDDI